MKPFPKAILVLLNRKYVTKFYSRSVSWKTEAGSLYRGRILKSELVMWLFDSVLLEFGSNLTISIQACE